MFPNKYRSDNSPSDMLFRIIFIMIAMVILASLAGCATANQWTRAGTSAAQAEADMKICEYEANLGIGAGQHTQVYTGGMGAAIGAGIGDGIADAIRIAQLRSLCLEARGYRRQS